MEELWHTIKQILLVFQLLSALTGCFYFFRLKNSYWKWFAVYLVIISIQEHVLTYILPVPVNVNQFYNLFFGLPLEFIFLYWLYASKSLRKKQLFITCSIVYIATILITYFFQETNDAISFSLNVGTLILSVLVVLEYRKQIRDDSILEFRKNKMFYINFGVILFYLGSLPFHVFQKYLYADYKVVVEYYYVYFLAANCIMYLLFIASFIWGKEQS
ncbi:hypothetical protein Aeqsu_2561 [Aequorivita sublithincola DSM 14238]|uniref:Uncharacterized protein n=1 Tax=Aequorivita sublithincola (strain DSM 14238 / LMG 21431 / ACAM 643 / 9-3) TaxID=746697 RepID=I3YYE8_AEQSU|nr:hypothetical protein [Aequorivita sublithincola]AFL82016.1 hypothetical protein Aeqsu_2561 [Aequorivita sublithincola DSM 14238]